MNIWYISPIWLKYRLERYKNAVYLGFGCQFPSVEGNSHSTEASIYTCIHFSPCASIAAEYARNSNGQYSQKPSFSACRRSSLPPALRLCCSQARQRQSLFTIVLLLNHHDRVVRDSFALLILPRRESLGYTLLHRLVSCLSAFIVSESYVY